MQKANNLEVLAIFDPWVHLFSNWDEGQGTLATIIRFTLLPFSSVLQSTLQNMSFSIWFDAIGVDF